MQTLELCLVTVTDWTRTTLKLNPHKIEILTLEGSHDQLVSHKLCLAYTPREGPDSESGVLFDPGLLMDNQISAVAGSTFFQFRKIAHLHPYIDRIPLTTLAHTLVILKIENCNALYSGIPLKAVQKLQQV